jgi:hypothetical protein
MPFSEVLTDSIMVAVDIDLQNPASLFWGDDKWRMDEKVKVVIFGCGERRG